MNLIECGKTIKSIAENALKTKKENGEMPIVLIGVDGRSGSGKSTFAHYMETLYRIPVIHLEDYPAVKADAEDVGIECAVEDTAAAKALVDAAEDVAVNNWNIDTEAVLNEVLRPLRETGEAVCRPENGIGAPQEIKGYGIVIIEGTFAMLPELRDYYDLKYFITINTTGQQERIIEREGRDRLYYFMKEVIPMEEKYLSTYDLEAICDGVFDFHRD